MVAISHIGVANSDRVGRGHFFDRNAEHGRVCRASHPMGGGKVTGATCTESGK